MKPNLLLLVEDDRLILDMMELELADAGFEVVTASNGTQAMTELGGEPARFRAIITDIKLGAGPDGWEVGRTARELVPDMPVLYVSGDSAHEWPSKGVPKSVVVTKPFVIAQVITAVSALLNEADANRATATVAA